MILSGSWSNIRDRCKVLEEGLFTKIIPTQSNKAKENSRKHMDYIINKKVAPNEMAIVVYNAAQLDSLRMLLQTIL